MKKCFLAGCALWLLATPALGQQFNDVVVFGDSLSDPGNIPGLTGGINFPPSPPYAENRFSNGPVYSEQLPGLLGATLDPSLNFAVGGALTGSDNLNSNRPSADPNSDLSGIVLPGIETQIDSFLADGRLLGPDDLVIVYGGANDVLVAAEIAATLPADQIPDLVRNTAATAAQNLATGVGRLSAAGGDFFILPNLPDIGATPAFTVGGDDSIALGRSFSVAHNLALGQTAADLQGRTGANIIIFDVNGIFNDIQTNPDRYGITNTTDACIDTPACIGADLATQNQFLFFDGIHPTAGIHAQVAQLLATTVRAPATLAAQGEVTLIAAEDFQRALIESFKPIAATASVNPGSARGAAAELDTAGSDSGNPSYNNPTSLFLLVDRIDGDRGERQGALGYRYDLGAVTAGLRRQLKEHLTLGGAFRIGSGDADIDGGEETFDHREVQLGLSATFGGDSSYIMGFANLGYTELRNIERRTAIDQVATSGETDAILFGAGVAAGHLIPLSRNIRVGPIGSLRYSVVNLEGYVESGPNFLKQKVENQNDIKSLVLSLGSVLEMDWETGEDKDIRLRLSALLEHDFNGGERTITSAFVTSPTTIETTIDERDRTTARLGADVGFSLVAGFGLGVGYETLVGLSGGGEHTIFGRATLNF